MSYNPLDPKYEIKNDQGVVEIVGDVDGAKPKLAYYRTNVNEMDNALKARDIHGNLPGFVRLGAFHSR